jgi:hypothetical protein
MEKQTLLKKAHALLDSRRYYDGKNWHAINVKRHNDYFDYDKFVSKIDTEYQSELKDAIESMDEYYSWLESEWTQLNYELSDLHNIYNKGDKWYHEPMKYVTMPVYSLGRSGGWACFESELDTLVEECSYNEEDGSEMLQKLSDCINEIEFVSEFIENYNESVSYQDYIENNYDCILDRIESRYNREYKKTLSKLSESKNETIQRHAKGILKELK